MLLGRFAWLPRASRAYWPQATALLVLVALGVELWAGATLTTYFGGAVIQDRFALFAKAAALLTAAVALAATDWTAEDSLHLGLAMPLLAAFGVMVAASAADLLGLWAGLELAAAASVVLVSLRRPDLGLRLLIVGAMASALILVGLAFVYATAGNGDLAAIRAVLVNRAPTLALAIPMLLLRGGLALRAGLAPFHVGALPVGLGASPLGAGLVIGLVAMAAATVAVKLAATCGPALLGRAEGGEPAVAGFGTVRPVRAAGLALAMLSLAGAPPLAGFFGELAVAAALAQSGNFVLLGLGLVGSVMSVAAVVGTF